MASRIHFYPWLDKLICGASDTKSIRVDLQEAAAYRAIPAVQEMNTEFVALDTKAAALISHLSLMIAAISILHSSVRATWLQVLFLFEIIFYVFTLMVVIRVIYYSYYSEISPTPNATDEQRSKSLMLELKKRMEYYRFAHGLTNIGTLILVISLVLTILIRPANKDKT